MSHPPDTPATVSPTQGIQLLTRQIESAKKFLSSKSLPENEYAAWETITRDYLVKAFGSPSSHVPRVMNIGKYNATLFNGGEQARETRRVESLAKQLRILESLVELLQTEIELKTPQAQRTPQEISGQSVFLVHGHEEAVIYEAARFLESLDLEVIILREQSNQGRTIIEKFVDYSDVGFAVVLLTPDDKGGPIDAPIDKYKPRARQNVLLELGYFIGKLGRNRVCALFGEGVEIPSDYSGVLFIPIDSGGAWHMLLARELKAAGIEIDMNKAI